MGSAKTGLMRLQDLQGAAMEILLQTGAVAECEVHEGEYIDRLDPGAVEDAHQVAAERVRSGEMDGTVEEYAAAIDRALASASMECGRCVKNAES